LAGEHDANPAPNGSRSTASVCSHDDDFLQWQYGERKWFDDFSVSKAQSGLCAWLRLCEVHNTEYSQLIS
jgi:hypothetical protein